METTMSKHPSQCLLATVLLLVSACGEGTIQTAAPANPTPATSFCKLPLSQVEARIDAVLPQMSLAEKVDQMHGRGDTGSINGLWYTPDNDRLGIPGFRMVDGARGVSRGTGHATAFPVAMARGATWDPALEQQVGDAI